MKKLLSIALGLAAVFGLTACVEKQVVSPAFNPVDNTINTQFVFNISAMAGDADPNTKQADTNVQANGNFRGIDNATLFALVDSTINPSQTSARKKMVEPFTATAMRDLSTILAQNSISENQKGGTRIVEINLPVGVNELVFYAKAARKDIPGLDSKELYGSLEYTTTQDHYMDLAEMIGSYAERRLSAADTVPFKIIQDLITGGINGLFRTTIAAGTTAAAAWYDSTLLNPVITFDEEFYTVDTLRWVDYACAGSDVNPVSPYFKTGSDPSPASELEKILGKAYLLMSGARYTISGGSGSSTARVLSDLYNIVASGADAIPLTLSEAVARVVFQKMKAMIEALSDPVSGSLTGERRWKKLDEVRRLQGGTSTLADGYDINQFPANFHLPAGATTTGGGSPIIIPRRTGGEPTVIPQIRYTAAMDTLLNGASSLSNAFTYAPELCYYGNSSIRTNNSNELNNSSYPNSYTSWYANNSWAGKNWEEDGTAISKSTRGIAMTNTIQYGVALLASRLNMVDKTALTDNGPAFDSQKKSINLSSTNYLDWTGILIGGQPEQVGWNYLLKQKDGVKAGSNAIIYDKVDYRLSDQSGKDTCGIQVADQGLFGYNYTLVYDNVDPYTGSDEPQGLVYVALEFVNHLGEDFWGAQGLIRDGETFYLLAALTPSPNQTAGQVDAFWDDVFKDGGYNNHYLLPPYNPTTGVSRPIRRVFVQDIRTSVDFLFQPDALSHAYISIPDLRSAKISLGLAVDLNWSKGLNYETNLGL